MNYEEIFMEGYMNALLEIKKMKYKPTFDFDTDMMLEKQKFREVRDKRKTDKMFKANQKEIERGKKNPYEFGKKVLGMKEEAFSEGYYDAIQELNEGSSTQDYLAHHTTIGDLFSLGIASKAVAKSKLRDDSKITVLYDKYVSYCKKNGLKPASKQTFTSEGKKFYRRRNSKGGAKIIGNLLVPGAGAVSSIIGQRSETFKNNAGMNDDY